MSKVTLSLLVLKTHQVDNLRHFYKTIGIEFKAEQHGSGPEHYAGHLDQLVMEIYPLKQGQEEDNTTRLGFTVDGLQRVLETLDNGNLSPPTTAKQTEWGLRALVKDPDGRSIELYDRKN